MIRIYKEGQGIWARGGLAFVIGVAGLFASVRSYQWLEEREYLDWDLLGIKAAALASVAIFIPFLVFGVWLYNHLKLADFLIDTESELKNKVTWPTRKEAVNNSVVVVVTCAILAVWIVLADSVLRVIKDWVYGIE